MRQEHHRRDLSVAQRLLLPLEGGQLCRVALSRSWIAVAQGELELSLGGDDAVIFLGPGRQPVCRVGLSV